MDFAAKYGPWALITGASAGLGAHYARQLASRGLSLVLVARRADRLEQLAAELQGAHGIQCRVLALDLLADGAVESCTQAVEELDVGLLVNNAGFGWKGPCEEADPDLLRRMIRLNCELPAVLTQACLPHLQKRARAGILMLASTAAFQPCPGMAVYGATKAFDLLLGEAYAQELRRHKVDVLSVCPGSTETEFHEIAGTRSTFLHMADPVEVVVQSLDRLGRRAVFVHGFRNRWMARSAGFMPRALVTRLTAWILRSRA